MDAKLKIHSSAVLHSINVVRNTPISLSLAAAQWPSADLMALGIECAYRGGAAKATWLISE
jgi:hypothetical protein